MAKACRAQRRFRGGDEQVALEVVRSRLKIREA